MEDRGVLRSPWFREKYDCDPSSMPPFLKAPDAPGWPNTGRRGGELQVPALGQAITRNLFLLRVPSRWPETAPKMVKKKKKSEEA